MNPVKTPTLKIADFYHGENPNFESYKEQGYDGFYLKATQGTSFTDHKMDEFYNKIKSLGMNVGFYHFMNETSDVVNMTEQVNFFTRTIAKYDSDYIPVLDVERVSPTYIIKSALNLIKEKTGGAMFYSYPGIMTSFDGYVLSEYPLWIAHYNVSAPKSVKGWSGWTGWQYHEQPDLNSFCDTIYLKSHVTPTRPVYKAGARGDDVKLIQKRLNTLGYVGANRKPLVEDGVFGLNTVYAVMAFQKKNGLTQDGIVGKITWSKLF